MIVIARLTVKELVRRRVVWVLAILTVVSVALVGWGLDRLVTLATENGSDSLEIQIGVSQVLILVAFMFSFVLAITAAFVARRRSAATWRAASHTRSSPGRSVGPTCCSVAGWARPSSSGSTPARPGCSRSA